MSSLGHGRHISLPQNRPSGLSSLTTLDGGKVRGYKEIPPVERSVVMQLCPQILLPPGVAIHRSPHRPVGTRRP